MPFEFKHRRQVEFVETDMAGIVHFSNFFRYMEQAEHAFYRSLGHSVSTRIADRSFGWPRVAAECRFYSPLKLDDWVETHLLVREKKTRSLTYDFIVRRLQGEDSTVAARGRLTVVCITRESPGGAMKAAPIPKEIADLIEAAPKEMLEEGE
jgi:YbgC/YbaW family acyl-CoA thioester hydrolase